MIADGAAGIISLANAGALRNTGFAAARQPAQGEPMNRQLAGRAAWVAVGVGAAWLLAPAWAADGVRSAREALVAKAVEGKLTARVVELYCEYAEQCARAAAPRGKVPADFWKWLAALPTIR